LSNIQNFQSWKLAAKKESTNSNEELKVLLLKNQEELEAIKELLKQFISTDQ
jgi:hypothetical protein